MQVSDVDTQTIIDVVTSSDGNLALASERLNRQLGLTYNTITEYDVRTRLASFDVQTADHVAAKFRMLLTVKLYDLIVTSLDMMRVKMDELRPAELARTTTSLMNTFAALTAPAAKITFDFSKEVEELAREFPDIPIEDIKAGIKEMELKVKSGNFKG